MKFFKKRRRRFRPRPKYANPPRVLNPHPDSAAAKRARLPRTFSRDIYNAYSKTRLERSTARLLSKNSLGVRMFYSIVNVLRGPGPKPPPKPEDYTVDIG